MTVIASTNNLNYRPERGNYYKNSYQESIEKFTELSDDLAKFLKKECEAKMGEIKTSKEARNFVEAKFNEWKINHIGEIDSHMNFFLTEDRVFENNIDYETGCFYTDINSKNTPYNLISEGGFALETYVQNGSINNYDIDYFGKINLEV